MAIIKKDTHTHTKKRKTQITNVREDVEKREPSYTVGADIKWYSCYRK